jgi:succinyl-CoA synthetase beta subunit
VDFEECVAKPLISRFGINTPAGRIADDPASVEQAAAAIGPCVVKAQVPTGKRGKAGGIKPAATPEEARRHAESILGMSIDGHVVRRVLVEAQVPIAAELYASVVSDTTTRSPVLLFSAMGGMDVEEAAEKEPSAIRRVVIDVQQGLTFAQAQQACAGLYLQGMTTHVARTLVLLYAAYRELDAELLEVNPLVLTLDGKVVALDCKLTVDEASIPRQAEIAVRAAGEKVTALEAEARAADLKYIELEGSVGILANGAGLTMTTMDAVSHYGGRAANFLEIGGEAYTKAHDALAILLKNPNIKSLLVNFCGAFARTDVMAAGVVEAWKALKPDIPVFFSIHGTGEEEATRLVRDELGVEPFDLMDDAVRAAVHATRERSA